MGLSCASVQIETTRKERPAKIKPPTDANGHILFAQFDNALRPYITKPVHSVNRPCPGSTSNCSVPVEVQEVGQSYDIHPENGPGGYRIIAILINRDSNNTAEGRYNLLPNRKYYLWVDDASPSTVVQSRTKWGFIEEGVDTPIYEGYVIKCHPSSPNSGVSNVDFEYCAASPTRAVGYSARAANPISSIFSFAVRSSDRIARTYMPAGETWFECDPGCCTGTTVQQ